MHGVDWLISNSILIPDNACNPPIAAIFWPPDGFKHDLQSKTCWNKDIFAGHLCWHLMLRLGLSPVQSQNITGTGLHMFHSVG